METNIYAPPQASLNPAGPQTGNALYVVSASKFWLLSIATLGMYSLYWYYRNWLLIRDQDNEAIWPAARALFAIFFIHSLYRRIDNRLRDAGSDFHWSFRWLASGVVLGNLLGSLLSRVPSSHDDWALSQALVMLLLVGTTYLEAIAQRAINHAAGDSAGNSNRHLSTANLAWIGLGVLFWVLILIGWFAS